MQIAVIYHDGSKSAVSSIELDELLQDDAVLAFCRSDGWATVGIASLRDPLRAQGSSWRDRKALALKGRGSAAETAGHLSDSGAFGAPDKR